mmetsp:Transcript_89671/g.159291  ORF Transcript_89671/g.159291 Transcript_89671/m.159291 type:complete len:281 (+) Transcript_89671:62-904(+)
MGQASCNELLKATPQSTSSSSSAQKPGKAKPKDGSANLKLPVAVSATTKGGSAAGGLEVLHKSPPPEPAEIQHLREELQVREQALQALRQEAVDHMTLIEVLERETFMKDEAIHRLKAAEAAQQEVASLVAEIRQKDEGINMLRLNAEGEEETLRSLAEQSKEKGDMVQELMRAFVDQESADAPAPAQDSSSASPSVDTLSAAAAAPAKIVETEAPQVPAAAKGKDDTNAVSSMDAPFVDASLVAVAIVENVTAAALQRVAQAEAENGGAKKQLLRDDLA